jgi:hypothetical protein
MGEFALKLCRFCKCWEQRDLGYKLARKTKTPTEEALAFQTDAWYYSEGIVHQIQHLVKEKQEGVVATALLDVNSLHGVH